MWCALLLASIFIRAIFHFTGNLVSKSALSTPVCWQNALLRLCAMSLVLPVLVALFGILTVYGRMGWLVATCQWLGIDYHFYALWFTRHFTAIYFFQYATGYQNVVTSLGKYFYRATPISITIGNEWLAIVLFSSGSIYGDKTPTASPIFMLCFASLRLY